MVSKRVINSTLSGAGAVGASGALAWSLGMFDGESLGDVEDGGVENSDEFHDPSSSENKEPEKQPEPPQESQDIQREDEPAAASAVPEETQAQSAPSLERADASPGGQKAPTGKFVRKTVASKSVKGEGARNQYFTSEAATDSDKKAVTSTLTWSAEWMSGTQWQSILVKAEETKENEKNVLWKCRLKPIAFIEIKTDKNSYSEFVNQGKKLITAIETNGNKEKFVENCSKSLTKEEKSDENNGKIELETEEVGGKVRFKESGGYFQKLWTQNFSGVDKLRNEDKYLEEVRKEKWNIEEIKEDGGKTGKIKISPIENSNSWFCSISGSFKGNLGTRKFREEEFRDDILDLSFSYGWQNEIEKKRYLIRNCRKNGMNIEGLTVQTKGGDEWEFSDLEKITGRMYVNT